VGNIEIDPARLISDLAEQFGASKVPDTKAVPFIEEHTHELLRTRYEATEWHTRR
jgi:hypothetical protein